MEFSESEEFYIKNESANSGDSFLLPWCLNQRLTD